MTKVSRSASGGFEKLGTGKRGRLVVLKNNIPAAVMLSIRAFEALLDELGDLRVVTVARERLCTFDGAKALTHKQMMRRFGTEKAEKRK